MCLPHQYFQRHLTVMSRVSNFIVNRNIQGHKLIQMDLYLQFISIKMFALPDHEEIEEI